MKRKRLEIVSDTITKQDWSEIRKEFQHGPHMFVLNILMENADSATSITLINESRPQGYYSARWGISMINSKFTRKSMPYAIRMVDRFSRVGHTNGSARIYKVRRATEKKEPALSYDI
jgi:hypothetical protein